MLTPIIYEFIKGRPLAIGTESLHGGVWKKKMADGSWKTIKGRKRVPAKKISKPVKKDKLAHISFYHIDEHGQMQEHESGLTRIKEDIQGQQHEPPKPKDRRYSRRPSKLSPRHGIGRRRSGNAGQAGKLRRGRPAHDLGEITVSSSHAGIRPGTRQPGTVKQAKISDITIRRAKTGELTRATREQINKRVIGLLASNRKPNEYTDAEKSLMRLYSGAGGTKQAESTAGLTEFYTPYKIVDKMWELARALGLKKGDSVLEPSAGTGRFAEGDKNKDYEITQLEQNETSSKINSILNPHTEVIKQPFEKLFMGGKLSNQPKAYDGKKYDLVIGNPPYGDYLSRYKGMGEGKEHSRWEEYFIDRSLNTLKDDGHMILIVPSSFLSKAKDKIREKIGSKAKLVDAYRLPSGVFAGSNIGTDIVVLKKQTGGRTESFSRNHFFAKHPDNVLGEIKKHKRGNRTYIQIEGPFSNVERIGHRLTETTKQKISQALLGNKNAQGSQHKIDTKTKKPFADKPKVDSQETEKQNRPTQRKAKARTTKKPRTIAEKMLEGYDFGEDKEIHDIQSFKKKYHADFTKDDLEMWSSLGSDGALDLKEKPFNHNTMSISHGKGVPDVLYASGNIYERLEQLEREKNELDRAQYAKQKKLLDAALPKAKGAKDIHFSPLSSFIQNFETFESETHPDYKVSISDMFMKWVYDKVSYSELKGTSRSDIEDYIKQKPARKMTRESSDDANRRRVLRRQMAEKLFNNFVREELSPEIRDKLVGEYNRLYNSSVRPDYKKIPVFLDGLSTTFKKKDLEIKPHQLEGLAYLGSSGKGTIAYDVGLGKTMIGIMGVMQSMQRGWCKKPVVVVPNAVMRNWTREFKDLFPDVKINVLGNLGKQYVKDPDNLKIKDGTVSILSYEGMKRIGYTDQTLSELTEDVKDVMAAGDSSRLTQRQRQKQKEKGELKAGVAQRGAGFLMEELGFDHMTIDEAHNMKNVFERAAAGDKKQANEFRYIQGTSSERGVKAFLHSQYIQKNNNGRNVTLLTATPFTNSPIEVYNMLSHVSRDKLKAKGLFNLNDFISTFVDLKSEYVIKANGQIQLQDVAKGFKNLKELQEIVKDAIDFKTGEEVNIKRPDKKESLIELPPTNEQRQIIAEAEQDYLKAQFDKDASPAAMLIAIDKQRKATLSPKLVTRKGHFVKDSPKLKYTFDSVAKVHKQRPEVGQVVYLPRGIDYYPEVQQYLGEQGIDRSRVAFIHSGISDTKKQEIMDEFNDPNGKIKIVVGSETIKEGVNLQSNSAVLYNTFLGWNPTELEQLRGRIWRQGNKQKNIHVIYPVGVDSIDSVMYQKHDEKSRRISEIWNFKGDYMNVSPIDPFETKYEIIKDPAKRAKFKITQETEALRGQILDKQAEASRIQRIVDEHEDKKQEIEYNQERVSDYYKDRDEQTAKLKDADNSLKATQKTKNKNLISSAQKERDRIKEDLAYSKRIISGYERRIKTAQEKQEGYYKQITGMGLDGTRQARNKIQGIIEEKEKLEEQSSKIEDNKASYLEKARKEIAAMQKPIVPLEKSIESTVAQVLTSIRQTDKIIAEEQGEPFAASFAGRSFIRYHHRRIIRDFIRQVRMTA